MSLKFRAWDKVNKHMNDDVFICCDGFIYDRAGRTYDTPNLEIEQVYDFEVMQSTGLKDKNNTGTELFEGDVVYVAGSGNKVEICPLYGVIFVDKEGAKNPYIDDLMEGDIGEKLGNIHENPELLK